MNPNRPHRHQPIDGLVGMNRRMSNGPMQGIDVVAWQGDFGLERSRAKKSDRSIEGCLEITTNSTCNDPDTRPSTPQIRCSLTDRDIPYQVNFIVLENVTMENYVDIADRADLQCEK